MTIEEFIIFGVVVGAVAAVFIGLKHWFQEGEVHPEPWGPELDQAIREPDATPACHHCFSPLEQESWFCPNCGCATGQYNNYMPWVNVFSEGEVLRNGVENPVRHNFLIVAGYILFSLAAYFIFAPLYWFRLARNLHQAKHDRVGALGE